jgi:cell division protease FtsH
VFNSITSGAANDIEKITKLARAMVTRYGMSETFDMMALETRHSQYLGDDGQMNCGPETAAKVDAEVINIIKTAHQNAKDILSANKDKLDEAAAYLLEKETITGDEFMKILNEKTEEAEKAEKE